jgi:hypothetical protein
MNNADSETELKVRQIRPWLVVFVVCLLGGLAAQAGFAFGPKDLAPVFLGGGVVFVVGMAIALIRMIRLWRNSNRLNVDAAEARRRA